MLSSFLHHFTLQIVHVRRKYTDKAAVHTLRTRPRARACGRNMNRPLLVYKDIQIYIIQVTSITAVLLRVAILGAS